jgi:archaemetzincin
VLAHEMAHMFSIRHCVYFRCLMNGSNHLSESDARPLNLCLVGLRELYESVGFDVLERYRQLLEFSQDVGFEGEARWPKGRIAFIARGQSL